MKKTLTNLLAIVLTLVMVLGIAPMTAFAEGDVIEHIAPVSVSDNKLDATGQCGDNVYWSFNSSTGSLTISGTGKMYNYVPDGSSFRGNSSIKSVTIESGVTSIGCSAFVNCSSLTSIEIPDSVTTIDSAAFELCDSLASIVIPDSVTSIGSCAFQGCSSLTSIEIPDSVTSIGDWAFEGCRSLTSVTIGNGVTSIGGSAFSGCSSLTSVTIGNGVTSIGNGAFFDCSSLTSVVIPDSVTSIGEDTFDYCSSLTSVTIGNGVTSIGKHAFYECSGLTNVVIPDSVTSIGFKAFYRCSSLTSVTIGNGVTSIGGYAFSGCSSLTSIEIPDSVTSIGYDAFEYCRSLTSITIPESVTSIGQYAFIFRSPDLVIFGIPESYAEDYAEENGIIFVAVNGTPYVTIHCQPLTDTPDFAVYGVANPNTEISIYDGETLLTTAKSDSRGQWKTTVTLNNPANNSEHTIKAVVTKNEESKSASAVVTYDTGAIFPVEFTLTHSGNTINLLTSKTKNLTIVPSNNFVFNVKLNKAVSSLKVTSTKDGVTKSIIATYDSATGCWVASGWFDPSNHSYAPGELGLEIDGAKVPVECAKINYLIDPSGYVYEAVKSNRVEGAGVIICYQDGEHAIPWDANPFEQENPQITDEMGAYHWDVTEGKWRIKVTKSGYKTAYSDWMQVPPDWTEVAIPLVTTQSPEVKSVEKGEDGYIITFSQYMDIASVNSSNVVFKKRNATISGTITPVNSEVSGTDGSVYYASVFKFVPTDANAEATAVTISNVCNYASIKQFATSTHEISNRNPSVKSVSISDITLGYKSSSTITPKITADEGADCKVTFTSSNPSAISVDNSGRVTSNKTFGFTPASAVITVTVTDSNGNTFTETCTVTVQFSAIQWIIKIVLFGWIWY